jgi:hypothetical protein
MGTRNLTMVQSGNEIKVAQYGQWDGYPSGQGRTILNFCSKKENLEKLRAKLPQVRFLDQTEIDKINDKLNQNDDETRRLRERFWSRDIGGKILENIITTQDKIGLVNNYSFGYESLFCEWAYCVNLDNNTLEVYSGFNKVKDCPTERFYKEDDDGGYYGVRLIKEYDLNNLPSEEDFINELEKTDEENN